MKRSQMLGSIYEYLYHNTDYTEEVVKELTEGVLELIENKGMIPPSYLFVDTKPNILNNEELNQWEEE